MAACRRLQWAFVVAVVSAPLFGVDNATAEILLDDFSVATSVAVPEMNLDLSDIAVVGELPAERRLRLLAFHTSPAGLYESGGDGGASLHGRLDTLNPRFDGDRQVHLQAFYGFQTVDATQAGANNAFLLDFASLSSPKTTAVLRVSLADDVSIRYVATLPLPTSDGPFTFAVPFTGLSWGNAEPDFTTLRSVSFTVRVTPPVGQNELDFSMRLNQIRIGREVPEPATASLAFVVLVALVTRRTATQR